MPLIREKTAETKKKILFYADRLYICEFLTIKTKKNDSFKKQPPRNYCRRNYRRNHRRRRLFAFSRFNFNV